MLCKLSIKSDIDGKSISTSSHLVLDVMRTESTLPTYIKTVTKGEPLREKIPFSNRVIYLFMKLFFINFCPVLPTFDPKSRTS